MELTRRDFLKLSGTGVSAVALVNLGIKMPTRAAKQPLRIVNATETSGVCSFCAVGCGTLVAGMQVSGHHKIVNVEGNPDSAINFGTLCSKGAAIIQKSYIDGAVNKQRLTKPLYRAKGASGWTEITWADAISKIAQRIKATRDAAWIKEDDVMGPDGNPTGQKVPANRTEAIGTLGSAELSNEGAYLYQKLFRSLGVVYIEHHARL
ncbi:MAG: twin-arginine translocation signal domain-containing protein [Candidatus Geothermincolia bacterium]